MNKTRLMIALVIGMAVFAAVYVWRPATVALVTAIPQKGIAAQNLPDTHAEHPPSRQTESKKARSSVENVEAKDVRRRFEASRNYWDFAHQILPAAKAGNADAKYYLAKILEFCNYATGSYFRRNGEYLTLDQALQLAAEQGRLEMTQAVYDRCHEFQSGNTAELGDAAQWLAESTEAGQPAAEATTAQKMYSQDYLKSFLKAGASETPENTATAIGDGADPRALLRDAVKSLDPEALFAVAMAEGAHEQLYPPDSSSEDVNQLAWLLVACQRGYDCSGRPDWVTSGCPNCGTRSPADQTPGNRMMTIAGDKWPAVQQRAQEINASLDAGQWDQLDLGS